MDVDLQLELRGATGDRVEVTLRLAPDPEGARVELDGVAAHLESAAGDPLCARMLLPIAGALTGPLALEVELRADRPPMPEGARIVVGAWRGPEAWSVTAPAHPGVGLPQYVRAVGWSLSEAEDTLLEVLDAEERQALAIRHPWIEAVIREPDGSRILEAADEPDVDELQESLGLGAEDAAWLKDLLDEED